MINRIPQYYFNRQANEGHKSVLHSKTADCTNSGKSALLEQLREAMFKVDLPYKDLDNTVFADGDPESPIMMIGEGPGENEVIQKRPFVGRSGQLLNEMLLAAGILRERIYTTNTVIWRPPSNRAPMPNEIELMRPYLIQHVQIIRPRVILLVGGIAYRCFMSQVIAISKIRGAWQTNDMCENIMCIFHPSYLLRSPTHRKETWFDILNLRQRIIDLGFEDRIEQS